VFLRVVSKDYRVALPEPCSPSAGAGSGPGTAARRWAAAVKVSFSVQTAAPAAAPGAGAGAAAAAVGATKAYARVPLQPHELDEVRRALLGRSALFGPSVIAGDALSVLLV